MDTIKITDWNYLTNKLLVLLKINNETVEFEQEQSIQKLSDGTKIALMEVFPNEAGTNGDQLAEVYVGLKEI